MKKLVILSLTILLFSCEAPQPNSFKISSCIAIDSLMCKYEVKITNSKIPSFIRLNDTFIRFNDTCGKFKLGQKIELK